MLHLCASLTLNVAQFFAIFVSNAFAQFIFGCRELDSGYWRVLCLCWSAELELCCQQSKWNIVKGITDPRVEWCLDKSWQNLIFRISTMIHSAWYNLNQTSAAKYWPNFSFKISLELQLQNLNQTLCSKSEQKFSYMAKSVPIVVNMFLSIKISNLNKFWVGILKGQSHICQVY